MTYLSTAACSNNCAECREDGTCLACEDGGGTKDGYFLRGNDCISKALLILEQISVYPSLYHCCPFLTNKRPVFHSDMRHITVITAWLDMSCLNAHVA